MPLADAGTEELDLEDAPGDPSAPAAVRRAASRAGTPIVWFVPVAPDGEVVAALELYRSGLPFGPDEQALARAAAAHLALALRLDQGSNGHVDMTLTQLELLGEALAAGADEAEAAEQIVRVAAEAAEAAGALLWRIEPESAPTFLAAEGFGGRTPDLTDFPDLVRRAVDEGEEGPTQVGSWLLHTLPLGEPPVAALQLAFEPGQEEPELARLAPFAAGAALALRRSRRVSLIALALKRSQTLVAVVSQAIAQLSLTHTLETAVERVAELTSSGHVGIYLQEGDTPRRRRLAQSLRAAHRPRGAPPGARARPVPQPRLPLHRGHARRPEADGPRRLPSSRAVSGARSSSPCSCATR